MIRKMISKIYEIYAIKKYNIKGSFAINRLKKDYINCHSISEFIEIHKFHKMGFKRDDGKIMQINKNNYKEYLSSIEYLSIHPINGRYSKWIDDKLTLKYLCTRNKTG